MKKVKSLIISVLSVMFAVCCLTLTACAKPSISLDKTEETLVWGTEVQLTATLTDTKDTSVIWSSSDESVAIVDDNGLVSAVETGTATITATNGEGKKQVKATCEITVAEYQLSITASKESVTLNPVVVGSVGKNTETVTASAVANGGAVTEGFVWSSSNEQVATVVDGVITAKAPGTANVTVTITKDGRTASDTVAVTVEKTVVETAYVLGDIDLSAETASFAFEDLDLEGYNGSVSAFVVGEEDVALTSVAIDNGYIDIATSEIPYGEQKVRIELDDRTIFVEFIAVSLIIDSAEDFAAFLAWQKTNQSVVLDGDGATIGNQFEGYFVLGANIDMGGVEVKHGVEIADEMIATYSADIGFVKGVFDGRGYTVSNFKVTTKDTENPAYGGIFGAIKENATVKNVAFTSVSVTSGNQKGMGALAQYISGTIENVLMSITITSDSNKIIGGVARRIIGGATLKDVVVVVNNFSAHADGIGALAYETRNKVKETEGPVNVEDVYVFGTEGTVAHAYRSSGDVGNAYSAEPTILSASDTFTITDLEGDCWAEDSFTSIPTFAGQGIAVIKLYKDADVVKEFAFVEVDGASVTVPYLDDITKLGIKLNDCKTDILTDSVTSGVVNASQTLELSVKFDRFDSIDVVNDFGQDTGINVEYRDSIYQGSDLQLWLEKGTFLEKEAYKYTLLGTQWYGRITFNKADPSNAGVNSAAGKLAMQTFDQDPNMVTLKFAMAFEEGADPEIRVRANDIVNVTKAEDLAAKANYITIFDAQGNRVTSGCVADTWYTVIINIKGGYAVADGVYGHNEMYIYPSVAEELSIYLADVMVTADVLPILDAQDVMVEIAGQTTASIQTGTNAGAEVTYALAQDGIVTVDANGLVTAVALGETTITVTAEYFGIYQLVDTITVKVVKATDAYRGDLGEIDLTAGAFTVSFKDDLNKEGYAGSLKVLYGNEELADVTVDGDTITIPVTQLTNVGATEFVFELDTILVKADVVLVNVIDTKEEVAEFANRPFAYASYDGYYKLGANIDMEGAIIVNGVRAKDDASQGFQGVFDGQGYAIYNFALKAPGEHGGGLFGSIGGNGVVKNLALIQAVWTGEGSSSSFGVVAGALYGKVENVIVDLTVSGGYTGGNGIAYSTNTNVAIPEIKNVIVRITNNSTRPGKAWGCPTINYFRESDPTKMVYENVYVIQATDDAERLGVLASSTNVLDITNSSNWAFSGFEGDMWNTEGKVPVLKNIASVTEDCKAKQADGSYATAKLVTKFAIPGQQLTYDGYLDIDDECEGLADNAEELIANSPVTVEGNTVVEIKYTANTEMAIYNEAGEQVSKFAIVEHIAYPTLKNAGTVAGVDNAYFVHSSVAGAGSSEWSERIQITGAIDDSYKVLTFKINLASDTGKVYFSHQVNGGTNSVYFSNSAAKYEVVTEDSTDWVKVVAADGTILEKNDTLTRGEWYTVYISFANYADVRSYICASNNTSYYIADAKFLTSDFPAITINESEVLLSTAQIDGEGALEAQLTYSAPAGATLTWTSGNESIATVDANGKVVAVANGETVVTVTCTYLGLTLTDTVAINVTKPVVSTAYELGDVLLSSPAIDLTKIGQTAGYAGITNVWLVGAGEDGANLALDGISVEDGKIMLPSGLPYGEQQFLIELDDRYVKANAILITSVLSTKEDVTAFLSMEKTVEGSSEIYDGYYILANNIDMEGATIVNTLTLNRGINYYGFVGVLDGRGFAIMNFTSNTEGGFFGVIGQGAVVKNIAFVNATMENPNSNGNGLIAALTAGTVQDVLVQGTIKDKAFANMAPFYKVASVATFTNVVTIIDIVSTRASAPIPSIKAVSADDANITATNVYGITESGIVASVKLSATTYDIWAGEKTFNLTSSVWDTTGALPTFKTIALYTMTWYKGDLNGTGSYYAYEQNVGAGEVGDTVTIPTTAPTAGEFRTTGDPIESLSVLTATLQNGTELKVYKKATNEEIVITDENGAPTSRFFTFYDATGGAVMKNVGTIAGQDNAFAVTSTKEWDNRVQVTSGSAYYCRYQGAWVSKMYSTMTFKICFNSTARLYIGAYVGGTNSNVYVINSANKVEGYNAATWIKMVDAEGNEIADGQTLTQNAWYTVTVDLTVNTGENNSVLVDTRATTADSYYLADVQFSRTAFSAEA